MPAYTGIDRAKSATLVAATEDTVTFTKKHLRFSITNRGGTEIFVRFDTVAATVAGDGTTVVLPTSRQDRFAPRGAVDTIRVISSGVMPYTVEVLD